MTIKTFRLAFAYGVIPLFIIIFLLWFLHGFAFVYIYPLPHHPIYIHMQLYELDFLEHSTGIKHSNEGTRKGYISIFLSALDQVRCFV